MSGSDGSSSDRSSSDVYDALLHRSNGAMVVVTASDGEQRAGCLVGFHNQSAIEPRQHAVWLSKANFTYRIALHASHLAVHLLSADDKPLAEHFGASSGDDTDKFAHLDWTPGPGDTVLLDAAPNRFIGRRVALLDVGGDHACFVLDVEHAAGLDTGTDPSGTEDRPLRIADLDDVTPGHEVEERPVPADVHVPDATPDHPDTAR